MAILATSDVVTDMNVLATSDVVTDMNLLATSTVVGNMNLLGTAAVVEDMGILATSAIVADLALLGTSDVVADMALLATSDVISDMNALATSDIISDLNTLATSDIVTDMNLLATSANVSAMGTLGTSANVTAMSTVSGAIANVNTTASNIAGVNSFAARYRVASSAPSSDLDEGDLYFNTNDNNLYHYNGSAWVVITSYSVGAGGLSQQNFTTTLKNKLDNVEASATADQTAAQIKTLLEDGIDSVHYVDDSIDADHLANSINTDIATGVTANTTANAALAKAGGTMTGDLNFGDNDVIQMGAGNDLRIYHDGSNSYIDDADVGKLHIRSNEILLQKYTGETLLQATADGAVSLNHDNSVKFATTAAGATVTGNLAVTGTVDGVDIATRDAVLTSGSGFGSLSCDITLVTNSSIQSTGTNSNITIGTSNSGSTGVLTLKSTGDVKFHQYGSSGGWKDTVTILGNGKVGIGATTVNNNFVVLDSGTEVDSNSNASNLTAVFQKSASASTDCGVSIASGTTGNARLYLGDSGNVTVGGLDYDNNTNSLAFLANSSERMRIDSSGKVLIGGTTNAYSAPMLLTVTDIGLDVTDGTKHLVSWASHGGSSHAGSAIGTRSNHDLALITNDVKRIIVTNSGKVGIGVVAPTEPLQVHGAIRSTNNASTTLVDSGNFYYIPTADDGSNPRTVISGVGTSSVGAHVTFKTGTSSSNTEKNAYYCGLATSVSEHLLQPMD